MNPDVAEHAVRFLPASRYRHPGDVIRLIVSGLVLAGTLAAVGAAHRRAARSRRVRRDLAAI